MFMKFCAGVPTKSMENKIKNDKNTLINKIIKIITLGSKGLDAEFSDGFHKKIRAFKVKVVSTHGAGDANLVGAEPEGATIEQQGLGWKNAFGTGKGSDTITSGLEGAWTPNPIKWDTGYFDTLFGHEWELTKSPAGAWQWTPKDGASANAVPDAHDSSRRHPPMMATTDISMREDPIYEPISRHFHENPDELADAFARAWFKLTLRDMGPRSRYLGALVAEEELIWQAPLPQ